MYNPEQVSYEQLLEKFTSVHNPTQLNRQVGAAGRESTFKIAQFGLRFQIPVSQGMQYLDLNMSVLQGGDVGTQYRCAPLKPEPCVQLV